MYREHEGQWAISSPAGAKHVFLFSPNSSLKWHTKFSEQAFGPQLTSLELLQCDLEQVAARTLVRKRLQDLIPLHVLYFDLSTSKEGSHNDTRVYSMKGIYAAVRHHRQHDIRLPLSPRRGASFCSLLSLFPSSEIPEGPPVERINNACLQLMVERPDSIRQSAIFCSILQPLLKNETKFNKFQYHD